VKKKSGKRYSWKHRLVIEFLVLIPQWAWAAGAGEEGDALSRVLNKLVDLITSKPARIFFILSIITVGYSWLYLGRLPKERAIGAIVGIGIIFSAGYIAQQMGLGVLDV